MFVLIEFPPDQGGGISLVNKNWLTPRKKEVFWPPYKDQSQFVRSLKRAEEINTETWSLYNVHKIFYETDNYDKAVSKLKRAEETSDLQSDIDLEFSQKRKRLRPVRFADTSSDSDSETDRRKLPPPPPVRRALFNKGTVKDSELNRRRPTVENSSSPSVSEITETPTQAQNILNESNSQALMITEKSGFHVLLENIIEIKNQNKVILATLSKLVEADKPKNLPENIPVTLPIKDFPDIVTLEAFLEEPSHSALLVSYYSGLGGNNVHSQTNRILRETINDRLACEFNFYGRGNKRAFTNLKICTCVINAVKATSGCTSALVENAIKIWLKHGPQRLKLKK